MSSVILPLLTPEDFRVKAIRLIFKSPYKYNLPSLLYEIKPELKGRSTRDKEYHKHYVALYRYLKQLEKNGFIELSKTDGLIWVHPKAPPPIDLIVSVRQNSNRDSRTKDLNAIPRKIRPEREEAIKICQSVDRLTDLEKVTVRELFLDYVNDVRSRRIILINRFRTDDPTQLLKILPYKTRFTDKRYKRRLLKHYEKIWAKASNDFKWGVFLTLTTDPKRFKNLWESWRHFHIALNRFFSYLRKFSESKIVYLCAYEFTDSGLLHAHIVLFGLKYLLPKRAITYLWERCGQGTINYVYQIQNANGKWVWGRRKPTDAKRSESVADYLKKYIVKVMIKEVDLWLYWVSGKRFYAYSIKYFSMEKLGKVKESMFIFFGSYNMFDMPYWLSVFLQEQVLSWIPSSIRQRLVYQPSGERFRYASINPRIW